MLQTLFPRERLVFQNHNGSVDTSRSVQTWLNEHDDEAEHLICCPQFPDLNIIEPVWDFLENKVRVWFSLPCSLSELDGHARGIGFEFQ